MTRTVGISLELQFYLPVMRTEHAYRCRADAGATVSTRKLLPLPARHDAVVDTRAATRERAAILGRVRPA
ncbi:hypothetical protein LXA26_18225, partial [Erwinia amylovora]|uniref:hypothetical protein n=1 Tax=Erwinia amylovora TaxID=552 RepID=UPI0020C0B0AF